MPKKKRAVGDCYFNKMVDRTASCAGKCEKCGWNPEVEAARKAELEKKFTV